MSSFSRTTFLADFKHIITVDGKNIKMEPNPRLLGVFLDRKLIFNAHIDVITARATGKLKMLAVISSSEWGWRKQILRRCYIAYFRSIFDYAGAGASWQP